MLATHKDVRSMDTVLCRRNMDVSPPAAGRVLNCEDITNLHMAAASADNTYLAYGGARERPDQV